jgi:hypothetical protein
MSFHCFAGEVGDLLGMDTVGVSLVSILVSLKGGR